MPEDKEKNPQRIADNIKAFLKDPVVQGSLIGAGGGGLLGLARTDREFDSVLPYIIAGGMTGGFGGAAAKSVREKAPAGPPSRTGGSYLTHGAGILTLALLGAIAGGGLNKLTRKYVSSATPKWVGHALKGTGALGGGYTGYRAFD